MPVYRSFLDDRYTYAVALGMGAYFPIVIQRIIEECVTTDLECVYTWRGIVERTAVVWSAT